MSKYLMNYDNGRNCMQATFESSKRKGSKQNKLDAIAKLTGYYGARYCKSIEIIKIEKTK